MGLLQRVLDLVRANLHAAAEKSEDPQKVIDEFIADTTRHIAEVNLEVSRATGELLQLQMKVKTRRDEALGWQRQAEAAVLAGRDEIARAALLRKAEADRAAAELEAQVAPQQEAVGRLKEAAGQLQAKLDEAKARRDELVNRQHRAEALKKAGEAVSRLDDSRSRVALEALASRTAEKEAEAEVATRPADPLEEKFRQLEQGGAGAPVDDALADLKKKLGRE